MRAHAREIGSGVVVLVMALVPGACAPPSPPMEIVETRTLAGEAATTMHIDAGGKIWLGEPGGFTVLEPDGGSRRLDVPAAGAPRIIGEFGGRTYLFSDGGSLLALGEPGDSVPAVAVSGIPLLEPRGRWIFVGAGSGAVLIHEPVGLRLISAWGALGAPTTAIGGSPEGDRIYQALDEEGAGTILTRDLQTGRVLRTSSFAAPLIDLLVAPDGNLIGILGEAGYTVAVSLRPWGDEMVLRWRERVPGGSEESRLRLSPAGDRVAIFTPGENTNGLRVLNTETGENLGHLSESPVDAAFDAQGRLILLYPGEVRVAR